MKLNLNNYDTIIFDLGNVIIELNEISFVNALLEHTNLSIEEIKSKVSTSIHYFDYETGKIDDNEFLSKFNELFNIQLDKSHLIEIWNSYLYKIPLQKLELMESLKKSHKVLILSNTNPIHEKRFNEMVNDIVKGKNIESFVDKAYYSHILGLRKPNVEIYNKIIELEELKPEKTIFFDDLINNIEVAKSIGIHAIQINHPEELYQYF